MTTPAMAMGSKSSLPSAPTTITKPDCTLSDANIKDIQDTVGRLALAQIVPVLKKGNIHVADNAPLSVTRTQIGNESFLEVAFKTTDGANLILRINTANEVAGDFVQFPNVTSVDPIQDSEGRYEGCAVKLPGGELSYIFDGWYGWTNSGPIDGLINSDTGNSIYIEADGAIPEDNHDDQVTCSFAGSGSPLNCVSSL
jgi:hypothetical protein